jgi:hypothetical protein
MFESFMAYDWRNPCTLRRTSQKTQFFLSILTLKYITPITEHTNCLHISLTKYAYIVKVVNNFHFLPLTHCNHLSQCHSSSTSTMYIHSIITISVPISGHHRMTGKYWLSSSYLPPKLAPLNKEMGKEIYADHPWRMKYTLRHQRDVCHKREGDTRHTRCMHRDGYFYSLMEIILRKIFYYSVSISDSM